MNFRETQLALRDILETEKNIDNALSQICQALLVNIEYYHWVGFYFVNKERQKLHLGPFAGEPTEHTIIPFGKGICGQVAESGESFLVDDVNTQENYIACSLNTQSELVVPFYLNSELIGQIDVDSNQPKAFNQEDELFLRDLTQILALQYGKALALFQKQVAG